MYRLFIANKNYSSWSLRPWVLMTELSIPFEENLFVFSDDSNWDEFRTFSPSGLVPCLSDGDTTIWDSLAITEYLAEKHPGVWPEGSAARAWSRCASAEMHSGFPALRNQCSMSCGQRVRMSAIDSDLQKDLDRLDELSAQGLEQFGGPFLAGDSFTAVDAFYCPVAFRVQVYGLSLSERAMQYVQRLLYTNSMRAWYDAAIKETWREAAHEKLIAGAGEVYADYRAQS